MPLIEICSLLIFKIPANLEEILALMLESFGLSKTIVASKWAILISLGINKIDVENVIKEMKNDDQFNGKLEEVIKKALSRLWF